VTTVNKLLATTKKVPQELEYIVAVIDKNFDLY